MTVAFDDTRDSCSETMANLLASVILIVQKQVCFICLSSDLSIFCRWSVRRMIVIVEAKRLDRLTCGKMCSILD
jgi:hypothetical protein